MTKLILYPIDAAGQRGALLGSAELGSATIIYDGSNIVRSIIDDAAWRWSISRREAFEQIERDGWSNGRLVLVADEASGTDGGGDDGS